VLAWATPHLPPITLAANLVRYEYDSGEKRFQEQLQHIYSKQKLYKAFITAYLSTKLLQTNLSLSWILKKTNICDTVKFLFVAFTFAFTLKSDFQVFKFEFCQIKLG